MKSFVISIHSRQAIGKTTLTNKLQDRYLSIHFQFENSYLLVQKRKELGLDINTETGFTRNQRLIIEAKSQRLRSTPNSRIVLELGSKDIEFHTPHYPKSISVGWDIEKLLSQKLVELRSCRSDSILYLRDNSVRLTSTTEQDLIEVSRFIRTLPSVSAFY